MDDQNLALPTGLMNDAQPVKATLTLTNTSFPTLAEVQKAHVFQALKLANGNKVLAAKMLDVATKTLYNKLAEYNRK